MKFDDLYVGRIVKINPKLAKVLESNPDLLGTVPVGESFNCVLYIDRINQYSAFFSCVSECGNHSTDEVCVYDYDEWSEKIGDDFFIQSSVNEYFTSQTKTEPMSIRDLYEFDPEEEANKMLEMLSEKVSG